MIKSMKRVDDSHIHKSIKMFPPFFLKKAEIQIIELKCVLQKKNVFPCCLSVFTGIFSQSRYDLLWVCKKGGKK